jgi:hypothetical protein
MRVCDGAVPVGKRIAPVFCFLATSFAMDDLKAHPGTATVVASALAGFTPPVLWSDGIIVIINCD